MLVHRFLLPFLGLFLLATAPAYSEDAAVKEDAAKEQEAKVDLVDVDLARGALTLKLPSTWKQKPLRSGILEREFAIPKAEGDMADGRLTMMRSGGSVAANVNRWIGQFSQPDGKSTKDVAKVTKKKIHGQDAVIVSITGTFAESIGGGPFAPGKKVERPDYQMLGGIVQTEGSGQYFFKLYGPRKTIAAAEKAYMAMLESVQPKAK